MEYRGEGYDLYIQQEWGCWCKYYYNFVEYHLYLTRVWILTMLCYITGLAIYSTIIYNYLHYFWLHALQRHSVSLTRHTHKQHLKTSLSKPCYSEEYLHMVNTTSMITYWICVMGPFHADPIRKYERDSLRQAICNTDCQHQWSNWLIKSMLVLLSKNICYLRHYLISVVVFNGCLTIY